MDICEVRVQARGELESGEVPDGRGLEYLVDLSVCSRSVVLCRVPTLSADYPFITISLFDGSSCVLCTLAYSYNVSGPTEILASVYATIGKSDRADDVCFADRQIAATV